MIPQETLTLLACQINIPPTPTATERDRHLSETAAKLRAQLTMQTADLVVLPELSSIDYSRAAFENLDEIAEPLDGISFQTWRAIAIEFYTYVAYSFARRDGIGFYISIAVVAPDGALVGHYDKLHLCQYGASMEKEYFSAGNHIFTFKIKNVTFAPIICYDIRIPELSRILTLKHGVDVILHCGAYYRDESFETWHNFTTTRAMENQIYLLSLNRAGETWGSSVFCKPWMDHNAPTVRFADTAEEFRRLTVKLHEISRVRQEYSLLRDRLADYNLL